MKRSYGISIFTGTLISIVISVSAIYMIMKSGMSVVLNTAVCSIVLLAVFRRQSAENAAISDIFARAAISVANLSAPYFAVIFLLGQEDAGSLVSFGAVIAVSGVFGVLFFAVLQKQAIQGEYPMLKPRIDLLAALKNSRTEKRKITLSMLAGAVFGVFKEGMPLLPKGWPLLDHPMFWLDNSLILVGTGYFIGLGTYGKLALGSLYSLAVWLFFRAGSFQEHLMNPYIFSVTVGFALATGILTLGKIFYRQGRELLTGKRKLALNNSAVGVLVFYVAAAAGAVCLLLTHFRLSPMTLVAGMVLPFGIMLTVGVGALLRLVIGKRAESYRYLFSGSSIGEGLVTAAALVLAGIRGM